MKIFVYLLSCVLLISIGSLFVIKKPDGTTWISLDDFSPKTSLIDKAKAFKKNIVSKTKALINIEEDPRTIYKWKDEKGVWHYSDKQLDKSINQENNLSEVWDIPNNLTVIPAEPPFIKSKKIDTHKSNTDSVVSNLEKNNKINALINDAKGVQELMGQRTKIIDENL